MVLGEHAGEKAVLPQMTGTVDADVVVLRVTAVEAAAEDGEGVFAVRDGDQVDVVGHEAPTQEADFGVDEIVAEEREVGDAILVGGKGLAAVDAPLGDVARNAWKDTAVTPWHSK